MQFLFIGFALLLFGALPGPSIFRDSFEVPAVHISTDRPRNIAWTINSTHSNAAIVAGSSVNYLSDGLVAIPTRFTWDVGTPAYTDAVYFQGTFTARTFTAGQQVVAAFLCPKTPYALPVGAFVLIQLQDSMGTPVMAKTGQVVQLNNGATAVVLIGTVALTSTDVNTVIAAIYNTKGGITTWATSGQTVDLGEVWFGTMTEFKNTMDPVSKLVDPTTNRRSHSNQNWALFVKPYKAWSVKFTPIDDVDAFDSSSADSFDTVRYDLATAPCALFLPRIYTPGTTTIDAVALNQLACFGRPDSAPALTGLTAARRWVASMDFSESPP